MNQSLRWKCFISWWNGFKHFYKEDREVIALIDKNVEAIKKGQPIKIYDKTVQERIEELKEDFKKEDYEKMIDYIASLELKMEEIRRIIRWNYI